MYSWASFWMGFGSIRNYETVDHRDSYYLDAGDALDERIAEPCSPGSEDGGAMRAAAFAFYCG